MNLISMCPRWLLAIVDQFTKERPRDRKLNVKKTKKRRTSAFFEMP